MHRQEQAGCGDQFEVNKKFLGDFQFSNELDLDARRIARGRTNGLRPARRADRRFDCRLCDGRIERHIVGDGRRGESQEQDRPGRSLHFGPPGFGLPASIALAPSFAASSAPAFGPSGAHRVLGGSPHVRPISDQPTQRPFGPRYPGPPRQPQPLHACASASGHKATVSTAIKKANLPKTRITLPIGRENANSVA